MTQVKIGGKCLKKSKKKVSWSNASSTLWITNYDVTESLTVTVISFDDFSRHSS